MSRQQQPHTRKRAVIYLRDASGTERGSGSLERQQHACTHTASQLNAHVEHTFADLSISGTTLERAGLTQLLHYVSEHPIDYVIAADTTRIAPKVDIYIDIQQRLQQHGTVLVYPEQRDGSSETVGGAHQAFLHGMLALLADYQTRAHSEAIKHGLARANARKAADHATG